MRQLVRLTIRDKIHDSDSKTPLNGFNYLLRFTFKQVRTNVPNDVLSNTTIVINVTKWCQTRENMPPEGSEFELLALEPRILV